MWIRLRTPGIIVAGVLSPQVPTVHDQVRGDEFYADLRRGTALVLTQAAIIAVEMEGNGIDQAQPDGPAN